jgi:hypothetical protein
VLVSSAWRDKFNIMTKCRETFHYRGDGIFMISGRSVNLSKEFKPERR